MNDDFLSHSDAAQINRNNVLRYVRDRGLVSRTDIWRDMHISRASVTQVIRQLQEADLIIETGEKLSSGGRMQRSLCINNDARVMYVFDWSNHMVCLVNLGGEVLESIELSFPHPVTPTVFCSIIMDGIQQLKQLHAVEHEKLLGLGVSLPGLIDSRSRTVLYSVELGWRDVNIQYLFADSFGENVLVERMGNMCALGEYVFSEYKGYNHLLLVLLENEGIGASAVVRGDCQHGGNYMYGELGHIKIIDNGILCSCGQRGCLEAVVRDHLMHNEGVMDQKLMEYIAFGVSTVVNLFDPGIVLLTGKLVRGLTQAQEKKLLGGIREKITNERYREMSLHICREECMMGVKGMSAYFFDKTFGG